ncbi:hypothetical protein MNEG_10211 [Monoraphidium neglectum]|uniref:Fibronectin type-III domain-containing protein n=1 Tax=Monoraphidium neglectum TaxID=145388 RepID=A0A0D2MTI6_9CHLO|nr:hypothetical protein MNEG_10211 [Monoraphidium neglectum]KIY97750.1 hypothetical protein MNEG_10211 [Monoraphidium neglectum]|eukprot:XP_013896770.1 hypothetical protein MNEG_10211 [Monoraphidium neglectum]
MCKPQVDGYEVKSTKRVLNSNSIDPKAKVTSLAPGKEYKFLITPQNKRGGGPTTRVTYKMKQKFEVVASGSVPAKGRRMFAA